MMSGGGAQPRPMPETYSNADWVSWFGFRWLNPVMKAGKKGELTEDQIPSLGNQEDVFRHTEALVNEIDYQESLGRRHVLLNAVVMVYWPSLLMLQLIKIGMHFLGLLNPLLLARVLVFQEAQNENSVLTTGQVSTGFAAIWAILTLGFIHIFLDSQVGFYSDRVSLRISTALRGAVLVRCVQGKMPGAQSIQNSDDDGKASAAGAPQVFNVLSFDVGPNISIIFVVLDMWIFPVKFVSTLAVLFSTVNEAAYAGLVVIIFAALIKGVLSVMDGLYRDWLFRAKDTRLARCNESFTNIRTLQMLSWTPPFTEQVLSARRTELHYQRMRLWMEKMQAALGYTLPCIVTLVTLGYYVHSTPGTKLKASVALPVISLVGTLIGPLDAFPGWINAYLVWRSAYVRVNRYLELEHTAHPIDISRQSKLEGNALVVSRDRSSPVVAPEVTEGCVAGFKNCNLTWDLNALAKSDRSSGHVVQYDAADGQGVRRTYHSSGPGVDAEQIGRPLLEEDRLPMTLTNLSFDMAGGSLLALVGREGQGKSSVFAGLLGELGVVEGAVYSPAYARRTQECLNKCSLPSSLQDVLERRRSEAGTAVEDEAANADPSVVVCFASQDPAIFTGSIRDNICFHSVYDEEIYGRVLQACCLQPDLESMIAGDLSELSSGGSTLSGGQRARVALARAVYRAALQQEQAPEGPAPVVLLDDPFSALDRAVALEICHALFDSQTGLLSKSAVAVATADTWWLPEAGRLRVVILQSGQIVAEGALEDLKDAAWPELQEAFMPSLRASSQRRDQHQGVMNPQDGEELEEDNFDPGASPTKGTSSSATNSRNGPPTANKLKESTAQTDLSPDQLEKAKMIEEEHREHGQVGVRTYLAYLAVVGWFTLVWTFIALVGIMWFQNLGNFWIAYWTDDKQESNFLHPYLQWFWKPVPSDPYFYLHTYAMIVVLFGISNFAGHIGEIIGGVRASHEIFEHALIGALTRPFMWWDVNPTGRVLNRFSEDVDVMDHALTNIFGVITGAVLYFIGHFTALAIANPWVLLLLPPCALILEYFAVYYRTTIREVHRYFLIRMGVMYQGMVEAIVNSITVRVFGTSRFLILRNLEALDMYNRMAFAQTMINQWINLRMSFVGYSMTFVTTLYPALQYVGLLNPRSAALIGFSMTYSQELVGIIRQFIMNFSDMEMQLVSIERLMEYAAPPPVNYYAPFMPVTVPGTPALAMQNVSVTYRPGLPPALRGVSMMVPSGQKVAIMGRTGAGKSSMLLSMLQLVPYTGSIFIQGLQLSNLDPEEVRKSLVGVVPQRPVIFTGSVRWNLDPFGSTKDEVLWSALQEIGLKALVKAHWKGLDAPLDSASAAEGNDEDQSDKTAAQQGRAEAAAEDRRLTKGQPQQPNTAISLSQGQRQLLCAARVLLQCPPVVLLDEVSASLPSALATSTVSALMKTFSSRGSTVLLVTHQDELLSFCDRVVRIDKGMIVDDKPNC